MIYQRGKPQLPFRCRSKIGAVEVTVMDVKDCRSGEEIVYRYIIELADGSRRSYREDVFWQQFERMEEASDPYLPAPFVEEREEEEEEYEAAEDEKERLERPEFPTYHDAQGQEHAEF